MRRADHEPERVRNHQADEPDKAGESHGCSRKERGRAEHRGRRPIWIDTEGCGRLFTERIRVDAMRKNECEPESQSHDEGGHAKLGPADDRDPTLQPPEDRTELQRKPVARDKKERDDRAGERGEDHAGKQNGQHRRATAQAREPPHERDRDKGARERGERHEGRGEAENDRDDGRERRARRRAGDERIGKWIAQETLQERARGRERSADERGAEDARKPQLADDRAVDVVRPEQGSDHVRGPDRDGPDEDPRSRAHDERGHQKREDR